MADDQEWGPWVEHDGKGCPVFGQLVRLLFRDGATEEVVAGARGAMPGLPWRVCSCWDWAFPENLVPQPYHIVKYQLRRPRRPSIEILHDLLADPRGPVTAPEGPIRQPVKEPA